MKITLELPDKTTLLGLFLNVSDGKQKIVTTNWLTAAKDGKIIHCDENCKIVETLPDSK